MNLRWRLFYSFMVGTAAAVLSALPAEARPRPVDDVTAGQAWNVVFLVLLWVFLPLGAIAAVVLFFRDSLSRRFNVSPRTILLSIVLCLFVCAFGFLVWFRMNNM